MDITQEEKTRARLVSWFILDCISCARKFWEESNLTQEERLYAALYFDSKVRALLKDEKTTPAVLQMYEHFEPRQRWEGGNK